MKTAKKWLLPLLALLIVLWQVAALSAHAADTVVVPKGKKPAISEDWVSQPEKVEPEPPPVDYLTKEPTARQTSPETETGQVQGVSDQRPDGWRIFWGILVALLIAAAVVVGVVATAGAIGMALAISKSTSGMARQPEVAGKINSAMMLGLVFIETAIIYALIVAILIIFVL